MQTQNLSFIAKDLHARIAFDDLLARQARARWAFAFSGFDVGCAISTTIYSYF